MTWQIYAVLGFGVGCFVVAGFLWRSVKRDRAEAERLDRACARALSQMQRTGLVLLAAIALSVWRALPAATFTFPLTAHATTKGLALYSGTQVQWCPGAGLGTSYDGKVLTVPVQCSSDRIFASGFN